jgi:glutamine amidotransferase
MIGIIDYRMGNLRSVQKAFEHVGAHADIVRAPEQIDKLDKLMLPGVGAFADGMMMLREMGYIEPLRAFVASGKPFMGICLGMQLLFDGSQEDAPSADQPVPGLGLVAGDVVQFTQPAEGERIKIPHMGWNTLQFAGDMPLFAGVAEARPTQPISPRRRSIPWAVLSPRRCGGTIFLPPSSTPKSPSAWG